MQVLQGRPPRCLPAPLPSRPRLIRDCVPRRVGARRGAGHFGLVGQGPVAAAQWRDRGPARPRQEGGGALVRCVVEGTAGAWARGRALRDQALTLRSVLGGVEAVFVERARRPQSAEAVHSHSTIRAMRMEGPALLFSGFLQCVFGTRQARKRKRKEVDYD